jgi:hypothetical protein
MLPAPMPRAIIRAAATMLILLRAQEMLRESTSALHRPRNARAAPADAGAMSPGVRHGRGAKKKKDEGA